MTTRLRLRRGTTVQHSSFTGLEGEITFDSTNKTIRVHDGSTVGGIEVALATNTGVAAGTYGNATAIPAITVDATGRVTNVTLVSATASGGGGSSDLFTSLLFN